MKGSISIVGLALTLTFATPAFATEGAKDAQPLTRPACEKAGMAWNENANVCGGAKNAVESKKEKKKKKRGKHKKDQSRLKEGPAEVEP
jgi:hypothetical protein